ncbi:MAG: prepilin-type N-terminal cleavage/methylation domain-containing protein [Phycisphaerae bacterium]|nr:prepilin-type N-terminal cleavage/methylation domain-containing protein [Phycisphaerae bacterium]
MRRKGFTLIELLVVIAIIGLLLAIIIPALGAVKEYASVANCLSSQKNLATAFIMYTSDNDDKFCSGYVFQDANRRNPLSWVIAPIAYDAAGGWIYVGNGDAGGGQLNLDARLNGIREGALYPYLEATDMFHCPGDRRLVKGASANWGPNIPARYYQIYRSYGMPDFYAVHDSVDGVRNKAKTLSSIRSGGQRILFVEDQYDSNYFNSDAWSYIPYDRAFWDPLGNYHNKSCTFSFIDGHAELYKWRDKRSIEFMSNRALAKQNGYGKGDVQVGNVDFEWLDAHYPAKTRF